MDNDPLDTRNGVKRAADVDGYAELEKCSTFPPYWACRGDHPSIPRCVGSPGEEMRVCQPALQRTA